jgi:CBS-domain-containing membrane protein
MTDLAFTQAFRISPMANIESANEKMIHCGVRLLFVCDQSEKISGLVTATDIAGERPINYIREHSGKRSDIAVKDIMTPIDQLDAISFTHISKACVGDIIKTLEFHGRQHLLVYETPQDQIKPRIRGLFSSTQIERQLGTPLMQTPRATTFAEIEMSINN